MVAATTITIYVAKEINQSVATPKKRNSVSKIFKIDQSLLFKIQWKSVKEKVTFSPKFNDFPIYKMKTINSSKYDAFISAKIISDYSLSKD